MVLNATASWTALRTETPSHGRGTYLWLLLLLPLSFCAALISNVWSLKIAGFRVFAIPSSAMENTLYPGDSIVADMWAYRKVLPEHGTVVLFNRDGKSIIYIKRTVATGGDTVQGIKNEIFVNEEKLEEPYAKHTGEAPTELVNFGPVFVPKGKLFMAGDNRDISLDSRTYGLINAKDVIGRVLYVINSKHDQTGKTVH